MPKTNRSGDIQYGALPYRRTHRGLEIMLITSRETGRWVIPKGWPMLGKRPYRVAEIEAFQEAGIKGVMGTTPIGAYPYPKLLPNGEERIVLVTVFPLRVTLERKKWRERHDRRRHWFEADEAIQIVDEGGLVLIINDCR